MEMSMADSDDFLAWGNDFELQEFKDMMKEIRVEGFEPEYFGK